MPDDLETRLRAAVDELPWPDEARTARAQLRVPAVPRRRGRWLGVGIGAAAAAALAVVLVVLFVSTPSEDSPAAPHWQPGDVVVPDFRGLRTREVAERMRTMIEAAGAQCRRQPAECPGGRIAVRINTRVVAALPSDAPVGTVLDQTPPPGERVAAGTYVRLTVSAVKGVEASARPVAPAFSRPLLNRSGTSGIGDRLGAVTVLLFVSSKCAPCQGQLSQLGRLPPDDTTVLVVTGDSLAEARTVGTRALGDRLIDTDFSVAKAFRVETLPTRVVIDRRGRVAATLAGPVDSGELQEIVTALKGEEPPSLDPSRATPLGLAGLPAPLDPAAVPEMFLASDICEIDPHRVWLLATGQAGTRLYVAQGPRVALAMGGAGGPSADLAAGLGCGPGPQPTRPLFAYGDPPSFGSVGYNNHGQVMLATSVVADGWTEATVAGRRIPIEHNGLVIEGPLPKGSTVHFSGPAGAKDVTLG